MASAESESLRHQRNHLLINISAMIDEERNGEKLILARLQDFTGINTRLNSVSPNISLFTILV